MVKNNVKEQIENMCKIKREDFEELFEQVFSFEKVDNIDFCKKNIYKNTEIYLIKIKDEDNLHNFFDDFLVKLIYFTGHYRKDNLTNELKFKKAKRLMIKYFGDIDNVDCNNLSLGRLKELGEFILFFLLESLKKHPIFFYKILLKTTPKMPQFGADGIHIDLESQSLIFGESKMHRKLNDGKYESLNSIKNLFNGGIDNEINVIVDNSSNIIDIKLIDFINPYYEEKKDINKFPYYLSCFLGYENETSNYEKDICSVLEYYNNRLDNNKKIIFFLLPLKDMCKFIKEYAKSLNSN